MTLPATLVVVLPGRPSWRGISARIRKPAAEFCPAMWGLSFSERTRGVRERVLGAVASAPAVLFQNRSNFGNGCSCFENRGRDAAHIFFACVLIAEFASMLSIFRPHS